MADTPDQKVEDVLSSVRRLVSNEVPRKPRADVPEGPGALVLTKDHMVPKDRAVQATAQASTRSLEDRIAELEEAVGGQDGDFEPDGSEDQSEHRPDRIVYTRPALGEDDASSGFGTRRLSQIALIETGPANDDMAADGGGVDGAKTKTEQSEFRRDSNLRTETDGKTTPEAPMAEDVPTEPRASAEVSAFSDPDDVVRTFEARIQAGRPMSDPSPLLTPTAIPERPASPDVAHTADAKTPDTKDVAEDFDDALTKAVAASLTDIGLEDGNTGGAHAPEDYVDAGEFDGPNDPELTAAEMLSSDGDTPSALLLEPEQDVGPDPDASVSDTPDDDATAKGADPGGAKADAAEPSEQAVAALAALPDEEALQLLIARMIRSELQGDLGEQITRNVRKLVRREVKRALSAEDLS